MEQIFESEDISDAEFEELSQSQSQSQSKAQPITGSESVSQSKSEAQPSSGDEYVPDQESEQDDESGPLDSQVPCQGFIYFQDLLCQYCYHIKSDLLLLLTSDKIKTILEKAEPSSDNINQLEGL